MYYLEYLDCSHLKPKRKKQVVTSYTQFTQLKRYVEYSKKYILIGSGLVWFMICYSIIRKRQ